MAGIGLALYRALSTRLAPFDEVFAEGREIGYNRGYWEGRREGRPVVVPIHQEQQEQERRSG